MVRGGGDGVGSGGGWRWDDVGEDENGELRVVREDGKRI